MNKIPKRKFRVLKVVIVVLPILASLLFGTSYYISKQLKPILKNELSKLVKEATKGLYQMNYSDVSINFVNGTITIDRVKIVTNEQVYKMQIAAQKAPNNRYHIRLERLQVKHVDLFKLYFRKKVRIKAIEFNDPKIEVINQHFEFNDNRPPRPIQSPYEVISQFFKSVRVDQVDFVNANVKYIDRNNTVERVDSVANLFVTLKDWLIDQNSINDPTRIYLLKDINVYVNDYKFATPDSMYFLKVSKLQVAAAAGVVKINEFEMQPRYPQSVFQKVNGYARDRFTIKMNDIVFRGLNFPLFIKRREIMARSLAILDGQISVSNDNAYPKFKKSKIGRFPHQLLTKLKEPITVDSIKLNNVDISYEELDKLSQQKGKITFENTTGYVSNVTNVPKAIAKNPSMKASLQSDLMGQGRMDVDFVFNLGSKNGEFSYKGSVSNMDLRKLNKITKPLGLLQISRGILRNFTFNMKADQNRATGTVDFRYNQLSVGLYQSKKDGEGIERSGILSLLANALVVYSDNPSFDGRHTVASIDYVHQPTASFFNYVYKALFEGIKHSVGYTPAVQREVQHRVDDFRQIRRDRLKRRANRDH